MGDNYQWAALLCARAGVPATDSNASNVTHWMAAENPVADWWHKLNPLNCGLDDGSADGEGSYPSLDVAASKSAQVLRQANMAPIWNALNRNATLAVFSAGCAASAWSTGGYHGHPGFIASIPQPARVQGPAFTVVTPLPGPPPTNGKRAPEMQIAGTVTGKGYFTVSPSGAVDAFGDAVYRGGVNNAGAGGGSALVPGDECTGIAACATGGYWVVTALGHLYAFGGAPFDGAPASVGGVT